MLLCVSGPAYARGGLTFGIDLGGAVVWGDTDFSHLNKSSAVKWLGDKGKELQVRTDYGDGFATTLRLGYNVMGYGALEFGVTAHGAREDLGWGGIGHVAGVLKLYPIQFIALSKKLKPKLKDRRLDGSLYVGCGFYVLGGYHYNENDGRGWKGKHFQWGATFDFRLIESVSIGLDLKFIHVFWDDFVWDWSPDVLYDAGDSTTNVFAPMLTFTFHLWDPHK